MPSKGARENRPSPFDRGDFPEVPNLSEFFDGKDN